MIFQSSLSRIMRSDCRSSVHLAFKLNVLMWWRPSCSVSSLFLSTMVQLVWLLAPQLIPCMNPRCEHTSFCHFTPLEPAALPFHFTLCETMPFHTVVMRSTRGGVYLSFFVLKNDTDSPTYYAPKTIMHLLSAIYAPKTAVQLRIIIFVFEKTRAKRVSDT